MAVTVQPAWNNQGNYVGQGQSALNAASNNPNSALYTGSGSAVSTALGNNGDIVAYSKNTQNLGGKYGAGSDNDVKSPQAMQSAGPANPGGDISETQNVSNEYFAPYTEQGDTNQQITQAIQTLPADQQSQIVNNNELFASSELNPTSLVDSVMQKLALGTVTGIATAGLGAAIGPALGASLGATGGALATGAVTGAAGGALDSALTTGGKNIGTSTLEGAVGGAVGAGVGQLTPYVTDATGLPSGLVNQGLKLGAGQATGAIDNAIGNPIANATQGPSPAQVSLNSALASGAAAGGASMIGNTGGTSDMIGNLGTMLGNGTGAGSLLTGLGQLGSTALSTYGQVGQSQAQQGAYNEATTAANFSPWSISGAGGLGATGSNGQYNINSGVFGTAANNFGNFAGQQSTLAGMAGSGANPTGVTAAGNTAMSVLNPNVTGTQSNLYGAMGANGFSQGAAGNLAAMGNSQLNNPLIGQANGQASNLLGSAGANYNSAYQTSLNSQLAALNPQIQQQSNALLNSNFERGQSGTSGGALNVQALQNSFNTADLQAQSNAVAQANSLMGTTYNAANTASGIGTAQQYSGTNMVNSGLSNFNNATGLTNTLSNSIYGQNTGLAQTNASLGQQGLSTQENLAAFSPQLASLYQNNANSAISGASGINNMGLATANLGAQLGNDQSTQQNAAARNLTALTTANNYNANSGNAYSGLLSSIFGGGNGISGNSALGSILGGASSLFGSGSGIDSSQYDTLAQQALGNQNIGTNLLGDTSQIGLMSPEESDPYYDFSQDY